MEKEKYRARINRLLNNNSQLGKYVRNYKLYTHSLGASLTTIKGGDVIGFYDNVSPQESDTGYAPQVNVIKSCIDTLTSKIAQSKVRPFFNSINGDYHDLQLCKQAQIFFDCLYSEQDVNKTISDAFRDSCIFNLGVIYIDRHSQKIRKALPHQVFISSEEKTYGELTEVAYQRKEYPSRYVLRDYADWLNEKEKKELEDYDTVTITNYYDTIEKKEVVVIQETRSVLELDFNSDVIPFVFIHYCNPVKGNSAESVVDMLKGIQYQLDRIYAKIKDASILTAANTVLVPNGSDIKASQIDNRVGNIIHYRPTPDGSPITVMTNAFIDPQYMQWAEMLKSTAYEMVGISQLSAVSQKPTGLNSGVALNTMENIESDRFETQLNAVIRAYVDIAKTCIQCFDKDKDILPQDRNRSAIKWRDVVKNKGKMKIQFSGADALSKDPSTKLQQLQLLSQAGILNSARIAMLMEIPDLEQGYNIATNAINGVQVFIAEYLKQGNNEIPDFIPLAILKEEVINTQLALYQVKNKQNEEDIEKLQVLFNAILELEKQNAEEEKQAMEQESLQNMLENEITNMDLEEGEAIIEEAKSEALNMDNLVENKEVDTDLETGNKTW